MDNSQPPIHLVRALPMPNPTIHKDISLLQLCHEGEFKLDLLPTIKLNYHARLSLPGFRSIGSEGLPPPAIEATRYKSKNSGAKSRSS